MGKNFLEYGISKLKYFEWVCKVLEKNTFLQNKIWRAAIITCRCVRVKKVHMETVEQAADGWEIISLVQKTGWNGLLWPGSPHTSTEIR